MRGLIVVVVLAVAAGAGWWSFVGSGGGAVGDSYRTAELGRGSLQMTVSSTGKVNPVVTVDVGSQVSGQVAAILADFNAEVAADQVIARIDPASFEARVAIARADLDVARAGVAAARAMLVEFEADVVGAVAALKEAESELLRRQRLHERKVISIDDVEKGVASRDQAEARLAAARAKVIRQRAQIDTALATAAAKAASLTDRELELSRTFIRSPVKGTVINRNVDVGQTVAASLQAPVLFSIAQDLASMQVEVSIDEADIGRIREGQPVKFTVDAYPGRDFRGEVTQLRLAPVEVANVVTYTVIVTADNAERLLLPGMTANVEVIIGARDDVLKVANAALRFRPAGTPADSGGGDGRPAGGPEAARTRLEATVTRLTESLKLTAEQQQAVRGIFMEIGQAARGMREQGMPDEQVREAVQQLRAQSGARIEALLDDTQRKSYRLQQAERAGGGPRRGRLWTLGDDGQPRPVEVVFGISDGNATEIVRGELAPGDRVIVGSAAAER